LINPETHDAEVENALDRLNDVKTFIDVFYALQNKQDARARAVKEQQRYETMLTAALADKIELVALQRWEENEREVMKAFHRSGVAEVIGSRLFYKILAFVNEDLAVFEPGFIVEAQAGFSFVAIFTDGRRLPASQISDGQKVMLSLAFLSSVFRLFAEQLGILALDEPLSAFDAEHRLKMLEMLSRWKQLVKAREQTVLIVTHDPQLEAVFDGMYRL